MNIDENELILLKQSVMSSISHRDFRIYVNLISHQIATQLNTELNSRGIEIKKKRLLPDTVPTIHLPTTSMSSSHKTTIKDASKKDVTHVLNNMCTSVCIITSERSI